MTKDCVHYWMIDSQNKGTCQKCGEERDFGELQRHGHREYLAGEKSSRGGKRAKKKS